MESWDDDLELPEDGLAGKLAASSSASEATESNTSVASTPSSSGRSSNDDRFEGLPVDNSFSITKSAALLRAESAGNALTIDDMEEDAFEDKSNTLKARVQADTSNTLVKAGNLGLGAIRHLGTRKVAATQADDEDDFDLGLSPGEIQFKGLKNKASFASHLSDDFVEDAKLVRHTQTRPTRAQKSSISSLSSQAEDDNADFEDGLDLPTSLAGMKLSQTPRDSDKSKSAIAHSRGSSAASIGSAHSKSSASSTSKSPTSILLKPASGRASGISASGSSNLSGASDADNDDFFGDIEVPNSFMAALNGKQDLQALLSDRLKRRAQLEGLEEDDQPVDTVSARNVKRAASHKEKRSEIFEDGLVIEDHSFIGKNRSASGGDLQSAFSPRIPSSRSRQLLPSRGLAQAMADTLPSIAGSPSGKEPSLHKQATTRRQTSDTKSAQASSSTIPFPRRPPSRNDPPPPRLLRHKKSTPHLSQGSSDFNSPADNTRQRTLSRKQSMPSLLHMPSSASLDAGNSTVTPASLARAHAFGARRGSQPASPPLNRSPPRPSHRESTASPTLPPARPSTPSSAAAIRLTMPTLSSRAKMKSPTDSAGRASAMLMGAAVSRPPLSPSFSSGGSLASILNAPPSILRRPKRTSLSSYGDGTELDAFDDLPTNKDKEKRFTRPSIHRPQSLDAQPMTPRPRRSSYRRSNAEISAPLPHKRKKADSRAQPHLIRNLGNSTTTRVEGNMTWNPVSKKWEGNENALNAFDNVMASSVRPALIAPFSIHSPATLRSKTPNAATAGFGGVRVEGDMVFDPETARWFNANAEEEELDFGDDEAENKLQNDPSEWTSGADPMKLRGKASFTTTSSTLAGSTTEDEFFAECREAEKRHKQEMRHWPILTEEQSGNRDYLWDIRKIVMEQ